MSEMFKEIHSCIDLIEMNLSFARHFMSHNQMEGTPYMQPYVPNTAKMMKLPYRPTVAKEVERGPLSF